ncbi:MAG: universal stress protein [Snowella sp.]|nr:universal stress protein [Snowella sp.]
MAYQKILVALDRSTLGEAVFQQAVDIAKLKQAQLLLIHCISIENTIISPYPSFYSEEMVNFSQLVQERFQQESQDAQQWLAECEKRATEQGISTESQWKIGDPSRLILELANSWGADLIVIGRRGLTGVSEMFLGSVSNYILHHAPCSVLVVQGEGFNNE